MGAPRGNKNAAGPHKRRGSAQDLFMSGWYNRRFPGERIPKHWKRTTPRFKGAGTLKYTKPK